MASPNSTFTELVSTTFRNHRKDIKDNVSLNNALYRRLVGKERFELEDGGLSIVETLDYAENGSYQRFSGYDRLDISPSDVISAAEFNWRQIAINVIASGQELRTNSGKSQIIKLVKARTTNAIRTFRNNFSSDLYSDGTLSNQINGLQALVADAGTGTVGGIDSSTYTFWKNKVQSAAAPLQGGAGITPGATTMESLMQPLWLALVRGDDKPDLIVSDNTYFTFYEMGLVANKRYTNTENGNSGFTELKYKSADVIFDGGSGIPTAHMYFLNTDYFKIIAHRDADFVELPDARPTNQDAVIMPFIWMGNLTISNRSLQGVLKA